MENIYLHGIANKALAFKEKTSIEALNEILSSGYLLSRRLQNTQNNKVEGNNGKDYISLCDYDLINDPKSPKLFTAFNLYIKPSLSLFFNKQNIHPETTLLTRNYTRAEQKIMTLHDNVRFSNWFDEVQVKDKISLEYLEGITIPLEYIYKKSENLNEAMKKAIFYLNNIDELLRKYNRKNKIFALEDFQELKTTNDVERALKKVI